MKSRAIIKPVAGPANLTTSFASLKLRLFGLFASVRTNGAATLVVASAAAQAIALISAPINSRLYSPMDYGVLGAYLSCSSLLGAGSTLLYHHPIVLVASDEEAWQLVRLSVLASAVVAVAALVIAVLLGPSLSEQIGWPGLQYWLYALPLSTIATGIASASTGWLNRLRMYETMSSCRIAAAIVATGFTLIAGVLNATPSGLLGGLLIGHMMTAALALHGMLGSGRPKAPSARTSVDSVTLLQLASKHRRYPLLTLPADLTTTWATWLPVQLLIAYGSASSVGSFSMTTRLLGLPLTLLGSSVTEVFKQRAAQDWNRNGNCIEAVHATLRRSALIGAVPFLGVILTGPSLFATVLGEQWRMAGVIGQVLAPLYFLRFVVSPVSAIYYIRNRQLEDLLLHILLLGLIAASMLGAGLLGASPLGLLAAYASAYALIYLVYLQRSRMLARPKVQQ